TFTQTLQRKGKEAAILLWNRVATLIILFIIAISILAWIYTPAIVRVLAPGFFDVAGKAELTISLTRIMIPFLLLIALAAQAMGMLNSFNVFGIPALASAFFNLGSLICRPGAESTATRRQLSSHDQLQRSWRAPNYPSHGTRYHRHCRRADQCFCQHELRLGNRRPSHRRRYQRARLLSKLCVSFYAISHRRLRRRHRNRNVASIVTKHSESELYRVSSDSGALVGAGFSLVYSVRSRTGGVRPANCGARVRTWEVHWFRHRADGECFGRLLHRSRRLRRNSNA